MSRAIVVACGGMLVLFSLTATLRAEGEGQADLDKAIELQLGAESLDDLEKVINLSESALKKGLDKETTTFAKELLSSVLYQRAEQVSQALMEGRLNPQRWRKFQEMALADLKRAVELNPNFGDAHMMLAQMLGLPNGNREDGIKSATEAIRIFEDDKAKRAAALVLRAKLQSDPDKQMADFDEAISNDAANVEAWQGRAMLYLAKDDFDKAIADFRKLLEADGDNALAHMAIAEALINVEKLDEALEHVEQSLKSRPDVSVGYVLRARIRLLKDDKQNALADLDKAISMEPRDLNALLMRARIYQDDGDYAKAKADCNRILRIQPGTEAALLLRSFILHAEGNLVDAIADANTLIKKEPESVDWRLHLGTLLVADGRPRKAIQVFDEVLKSHKDEWRVMRARADALLSVGKHKEAVADYEAALKLEPEDDGILNNFAWVLATSPVDEVRSGKRSLELATKACEVTKYEQPHILSTLAAAYAETGDFESARKWSQKAVELGKGEVGEQLKKELEGYQQNKPWRETQNVEEKPEPVSKSKTLIDT